MASLGGSSTRRYGEAGIDSAAADAGRAIDRRRGEVRSARRYLAIAVDAAHLAPRLDARVPLFAVLEHVALEAAAAGREDVRLAAGLRLLAEQVLVGGRLLVGVGRRRGRRRRALLAAGHRVGSIGLAVRAVERRARLLRALDFERERLYAKNKNNKQLINHGRVFNLQ